MRKSRFVLAFVLSLLLALVVVMSAIAETAPAAAKSKYKVRLKNATVPWFFQPPDGLNNAVCSYIPPGYNINPDDNASHRLKTAVVQELPNGAKRILVSDKVNGTASDNLGSDYRFRYRNDIKAVLDGSVVSVVMVDEFVLKGPVNHTVKFKWAWQFYADNIAVEEIFDGGKVVNLDIVPFFWPTDDGVNPTTNPQVVPNSWIQYYTIGGGVLCDPI